MFTKRFLLVGSSHAAEIYFHIKKFSLRAVDLEYGIEKN